MRRATAIVTRYQTLVREGWGVAAAWTEAVELEGGAPAAVRLAAKICRSLSRRAVQRG